MKIFLLIEFSLFVKIRFSGIVQQILVEIRKNIETQEQSLKLIKKFSFSVNVFSARASQLLETCEEVTLDHSDHTEYNLYHFLKD